MYVPECTVDPRGTFFKLEGEEDRTPEYYVFSPPEGRYTSSKGLDEIGRRIPTQEYEYIKKRWERKQKHFDRFRPGYTPRIPPNWNDERYRSEGPAEKAWGSAAEICSRQQYWDDNCELLFRVFLKYNNEPVRYTPEKRTRGGGGSRGEAIRRYLKVSKELKGQTELYIGDGYFAHLEYYPFIGAYSGPTVYEMGFSLFLKDREIGRILAIKADGEYFMISTERVVICLKRECRYLDIPDPSLPSVDSLDEIFVDGPEPEDKTLDFAEIIPYEERRDLEEALKQSLADLEYLMTLRREENGCK